MKIMFGFFALVVTGSTLADPIPMSLVREIKVFQIEESSLAEGVLRVRYKKPVVTQDIFRTFVNASCTPLWLDQKKDGWEKARIDRVEVVNQVGAQGFAFIGGRTACAELGKVSGGSIAAHEYMATRTWVCVAGSPCRPRRTGERTSGDE